MSDYADVLNDLFAPNGSLDQDVLDTLHSIMRMFSISSEELFYKWESYIMKMKIDGNKIDLQAVQDLKRDLQDQLERETRAKVQPLQTTHKKSTATPRASAGTSSDVFGIIDGLASNTPATRTGGSAKRKANFDTPAAKFAKNLANGSPPRTPPVAHSSTFTERSDAGEVIEHLNEHLDVLSGPIPTPDEPRAKLKANTDISKFAYRGMAMKLSEASEILDDRIDAFTDIVRVQHGFPDTAFGNPAAQSTAEIVAVGRIAYEGSSGKLTSTGIVLETSRRMGAGLRVPLRLDDLSYDFFPGKIVALKGTNVSGEYFAVSQILTLPLLQLPASTPAELDAHSDRLKDAEGNVRPLGMMIASGPYTTDDDLSFEALRTVLDQAQDRKTDVLILFGPFLDLEHPLVASGNFETYLPPDAKLEPDRTTLRDVFRLLISQPIQNLVQALPSITIILVPSLRDAVSNHVSWPQDKFPKAQLGLPKQCFVVTNPITLSVNEIVIGISALDVLDELRRDIVRRRDATDAHKRDVFATLVANVIEQRHFFPKFPPESLEKLLAPTQITSETQGVGAQKRNAVGANLDLGYLKLGEWLNVTPDMLILPSVLTPFAKVVENVVCINPGTLSKRRGTGTYASVLVHPLQRAHEDPGEQPVLHDIQTRARVDIVKA